MTVLGPVLSEALGSTLAHEHVLVDFIGAELADRSRYDGEEAFQVALPHLRRLKELGCETLIECTPAYIGRDPNLLRRLSRASGLHILTNTGYYGAGQNKFLPRHAHEESADELCARWVLEWRGGIEGTGVRPGFIKIGVDAGGLSGLHRKLVTAAGSTHSKTGLTIAAHTGNGLAALAQLEVLRTEGVDPSAFVWVHAQNEKNSTIHLDVARQGAWVEFDGIGPDTIVSHVQHVETLRKNGLLGRILVSQDAGWYHVGEKGGGKFRSFETLYTQFLPALRKSGWNEEEIDQLMQSNPREAFAIRARKA